MEQIFNFIKRFDKITKNTDLFIAFSLLAILAVMIVPLPPILLDLALSFSLALSLLILLTSVYIKRALEFSSFPSLLLMTTLFRLGLNVATTRLILSHGHEGTSAAGSSGRARTSAAAGIHGRAGLFRESAARRGR